MQSAKSKGTAMTSFIKAVVPAAEAGDGGGGNRKYHNVMTGLSSSLCAGGVRTGAVNHMASNQVPADCAVHTTGHDLDGFGNLYAYLDANLSLGMVGAVSLVGWEAPPHGQCTPGARPADPNLFTSVLGVNDETLNGIVDDLFNMGSHSFQILRRGGRLRRLLLVAFASLVMHTPERVRRNVMRATTVRLWEIVKSHLSVHLENAKQIVSNWSASLLSKFKVDNLHMTSVTLSNDASAQQIITSMRSMSDAVINTRRACTDMSADLKSMRNDLQSLSARVERMDMSADLKSMPNDLQSLSARVEALAVGRGQVGGMGGMRHPLTTPMVGGGGMNTIELMRHMQNRQQSPLALESTQAPAPPAPAPM